MEDRPLITRVVLENYKSIAFCDVKLGPLSILVGPNGAGKSNFLDALRFLSQAIVGGPQSAVSNRGGYASLLRRAKVNHLGLRIEFVGAAGVRGIYSIRLRRDTISDFVFEREKCIINSGTRPADYFDVENGRLIHSSVDTPPSLTRDVLYLPVMGGYPQFKPVDDLITQFRFYNLHPKEFLQPATDEDRNVTLRSDATNLANVFNNIKIADLTRRTLSAPELDRTDRIIQYLRAINPALKSVSTQAFGGFRSIQFFLKDSPDEPYLSRQMSDGTLRSLAVLVALFQGVGGVREISVIGLEEPEAALHPAAAGVLFDAMREASASVQVIATTHSADLLDKKEIDTDAILAVEFQEGMTRIGNVDQTGRQALKKQLYTAGELMRMNYLRPEPSKGPDDSEMESLLFGDPVPV